MANQLKMARIQAIQQLQALGWSQRRIARELGLDRATVRKYGSCGSDGPKPAIPPSGCEGAKPATVPGLPGSTGVGGGVAGNAECAAGPKPAIPPAGSVGGELPSKPAIPPAGSDVTTPPPAPRKSRGRPSECEAYREIILAQLDQDLTAQRIYQDLVAEHGFTAHYDSVKRFVRKLGATRSLPWRRIEVAPGVEAQVDFGTGAPLVGPDGKRRKTYVFRIVLSHSRKGYSEATERQTTEDFLRCLENAFAHFGGVVETLVIDNLKAAVKHPDWFDPELVPRFAACCAHYGVTVLPTRPYTPRHKGKVERGVAYVQENALQGRTFASLAAQNEFLAEWERTIADTRIHGTTRRQVGKVFAEVERAALRPLPRERFPFFHEAQRIVNRDGHVEVAKAYYSVPPEYLTRKVWVRWDSRLVRIFNHRFEQLALHVRHEQGRFSTQGQHIAREKIHGLERGAAYLLSRAAVIGAHTQAWSQALVTARGIEGTRVLLGLLSLAKKHPSETLETACEIALSHGAFRLRTIRQLLQRHEGRQQPLPFLDEHPLIRPLEDYARVVAAALERKGPLPGEDHRQEDGFLRHGEGVPWASKAKDPGCANSQGPAASGTRLRSGYPSSGCTAAEPDSVSPDLFTVRPVPTSQQEKADE
jgi:transposase